MHINYHYSVCVCGGGGCVRACVHVCVCVCVYFIVPCGKFGSPYLGKAQQPQEQRYPFLVVCQNNGMAANVWDLVTCAQMLMHEIAHGGDVPTPPESALELTLGEKSLAAPGTRTRVSIAAGFSVGRCTNGAIPAL